ncbi:tumor necrosis factor ligand superfamily member 14-like isoform X2 [Sardina pilchardus]
MADDVTPEAGSMLDSQVKRYAFTPETRQPKTQRELYLNLLFLIVIVVQIAVLVEACFILHLYTTRSPSAQGDPPLSYEGQIQHTMSSNSMKKPSKPMAYLIGANKLSKGGVIFWEVGDGMDGAIKRKIKYDNGKIIIQEEGYYSIFSKMYLKETQKHLILHEIVKTTPRYPKEIVLLRSKRFPPRAAGSGSRPTTTSYLGGVFHLFENEAIFVKVNNHTEVVLQLTSNYFGAYMV